MFPEPAKTVGVADRHEIRIGGNGPALNLRDITGKRPWMINKNHLAQLIEIGLAEMRKGVPYLIVAHQNEIWRS